MDDEARLGGERIWKMRFDFRAVATIFVCNQSRSDEKGGSCRSQFGQRNYLSIEFLSSKATKERRENLGRWKAVEVASRGRMTKG